MQASCDRFDDLFDRPVTNLIGGNRFGIDDPYLSGEGPPTSSRKRFERAVDQGGNDGDAGLFGDAQGIGVDLSNRTVTGPCCLGKDNERALIPQPSNHLLDGADIRCASLNRKRIEVNDEASEQWIAKQRVTSHEVTFSGQSERCDDGIEKTLVVASKQNALSFRDVFNTEDATAEVESEYQA